VEAAIATRAVSSRDAERETSVMAASAYRGWYDATRCEPPTW
jgi:hypothetical protein